MIARIGALLILYGFGAVISLAATPSPIDQSDAIEAAVTDATRPAESLARDTDRKPRDVLAFSGIRPADQVVEIAPASGYYTALLSRVVGARGAVHAVDPARIFEHFPQGREGFPAYIEQDPRDNVRYSVQNLDELDVPAGIDQVWMILYYHDTLWTGEDRAAMNRRIFDALVPGGVYLVVDHHGQPGAAADVARTLHRMDEAIARREIEAAGFRLDAASDVLANPEDPRDDSVFAEGRRGRTDRFVYRFAKPH